MPSQLSRQSVRLLTDWSQVRALSMALLGPQLSQVERPAHNRKAMGSNPIGPISIKLCHLLLRWCSPANHFGLSSRRLGFESRSEHFLEPFLFIIWYDFRFQNTLSETFLNKVCGYKYFICGGARAGQRGQAQDLLAQASQGSNPCSRTLDKGFRNGFFKCRGRIVVILRDCGSRDSGSILGPGPI